MPPSAKKTVVNDKNTMSTSTHHHDHEINEYKFWSSKTNTVLTSTNVTCINNFVSALVDQNNNSNSISSSRLTSTVTEGT